MKIEEKKQEKDKKVRDILGVSSVKNDKRRASQFLSFLKKKEEQRQEQRAKEKDIMNKIFNPAAFQKILDKGRKYGKSTIQGADDNDMNENALKGHPLAGLLNIAMQAKKQPKEVIHENSEEDEKSMSDEGTNRTFGKKNTTEGSEKPISPFAKIWRTQKAEKEKQKEQKTNNAKDEDDNGEKVSPFAKIWRAQKVEKEKAQTQEKPENDSEQNISPFAKIWRDQANKKAKEEESNKNYNSGGPLPDLSFLSSLGNTQNKGLDVTSQNNSPPLPNIDFASTINRKDKIPPQQPDPDSARFLNKSNPKLEESQVFAPALGSHEDSPGTESQNNIFKEDLNQPQSPHTEHPSPSNLNHNIDVKPKSDISQTPERLPEEDEEMEDMVYELNTGSITFKSMLNDDQRIELTKLADNVYQKSVFYDTYKPHDDVVNSNFFKGLDRDMQEKFKEFNKQIFK